MRDKLLINSGGLAMGSPATSSAIKHPLNKQGMEVSNSAAKKGGNGKFDENYDDYFFSRC
jgi:hypothetical protein